jgi:hypothetical protein
MNALMTAIVIWLSANFGLPAAHELPQVEYVPAMKIAALRYKGLAVPQFQAADRAEPGRRAVVAVYEDATRIIYLPDGWSADSPADLSVLVHEMVHHLQNVARQKFFCPQEREALAYEAQQRWLGLFGHDLLSDFEIDRGTLLLSTRCAP